MPENKSLSSLTDMQVYELTAMSDHYTVALADAVVLKRLESEIPNRIISAEPSPHRLACWLHDNEPEKCRAVLHRAVSSPETPAEDALRLAVIDEMAAREEAEKKIEMEEAL